MSLPTALNRGAALQSFVKYSSIPIIQPQEQKAPFPVFSNEKLFSRIINVSPG
jgi:hypothetical protein